MTIKVCLAGATGWAGSSLARAIARTPDLQLVAGISRRQAGRKLGEVLGIPELDIPLCGSADEALQTACDVFVEYTQPEVAKGNVSAAIRQGAHVVLGTSGLADDDLDELGELARQHKVGLLAVGNFSTAAMVLAKSAELAARYLPQWEILDYASATKPDAPSGTARELAFKLSKVRAPEITIPIERTQGRVESRGATLNGIQVHAVRLPGHVLSVEVVFGTGDEKLSIRYDAGTSPEPYVEGALAAIRRVSTLTGLKRGLDSIMDV